MEFSLNPLFGGLIIGLAATILMGLLQKCLSSNTKNYHFCWLKNFIGYN